MEMYSTLAFSPSAWPEPMESVYQALPASGPVPRNARRRDIRLGDRLFMGAVLAIPRRWRYGAVTWLADVYCTSRQTVYDIAGNVHGAVGHAPAAAPAEVPPATTPIKDEAAPITHNQLARAALTLRFPGGTSLRPMETCLEELLGTARSPAWLSIFLSEAGERAGRVLDEADWSAVKPFIATRDEKFFHDRAYLLTVEPQSMAVVSGHVEDGVDGDRWAVSLALDQDRIDHAIIGLAEDAAKWYPSSLTEAAALLDTPHLMPVQKDVFHVLARARQTLTDLERTALKKLATAEKKATRHKSGMWLIRKGQFDSWEAAHAAADAALDRAQALHVWVDCLHDAFEVVELGSGAIRDAETATWYLEQILSALETIDDQRVRSLAGYIRHEQHQLFTFLEWLDVGLAPWRQSAAEHFGDPDLALLFERAVARTWRRHQGVTNGQGNLRRAARLAQAEVDRLCHHDGRARRLALELTALLEVVVRTSSASECFNSLLAHFLWTKRSFPDRLSAQRFLNLLILWHCMRPFQRGKRKDFSPFQLAGVRVFDPDGNETDDWMTALGYPAAA